MYQASLEKTLAVCFQESYISLMKLLFQHVMIVQNIAHTGSKTGVVVMEA